MIGKLLDHRYQIIRVLATGGFGETYIAQDTKRPGNPICVVKHLKPVSTNPSLFETAKRLFHNEAETLERLGNHDQIPRLLAYFDENQEFYLVQEFIEGHPLNDELISGAKWSEGQVVEMLIEVLAILEFVHSQGVIHRDIKPENIIRRTGDQKLVLLDFGAVKQLRSPLGYYAGQTMLNGAQPSATVAIGTPGYMPTEQGQGKPRPNSDIYALGIIAIQALTGVSPIDIQEDPQTGEILWQHLVSVDPDLAAVLTTMVRYHFKDRYQTAREALQALQLFSTYSESAQYSKNISSTIIKTPSIQSQQKTLAVAPARPALPAPVETASKPAPVSKGSNGPDLLQLFILIVLAGGAAVIAPTVVKNVQSFAGNLNLPESNETIAAHTCLAVVADKANIRSQPSTISGNILEKATKGRKLEVTGKRTKRGWVEVKFDVNRPAWVHSDVIRNKDEWVTCLRDKAIAVKTVDDNTLLAERPAPKPKPIDDVETPENSEPSLLPSLGKTPTENSNETLEQAREKYESGDLQGAIEQLRSVPTNASNGFKETAEMITQWQKDWEKSEELFNDINKALDNGQWDKVLSYKDHPEKLPDIEYWRKRIEPLFQQAAENAAKQKPSQTNKLDKKSE